MVFHILKENNAGNCVLSSSFIDLKSGLFLRKHRNSNRFSSCFRMQDEKAKMFQGWFSPAHNQHKPPDIHRSSKMLMISTFYQGNFQQKSLIINILPRLHMLTYAYVLVKTILYICVGMVIACAAHQIWEICGLYFPAVHGSKKLMQAQHPDIQLLFSN